LASKRALTSGELGVDQVLNAPLKNHAVPTECLGDCPASVPNFPLDQQGGISTKLQGERLQLSVIVPEIESINQAAIRQVEKLKQLVPRA